MFGDQLVAIFTHFKTGFEWLTQSDHENCTVSTLASLRAGSLLSYTRDRGSQRSDAVGIHPVTVSGEEALSESSQGLCKVLTGWRRMADGKMQMTKCG